MEETTFERAETEMTIDTGALFEGGLTLDGAHVEDVPDEDSDDITHALVSHHLNVYYGDFRAVRDANLRIQERKITAIIGPSGCGKSTLLRAFNRMNELVPTAWTEGQVIFRGVNIYGRQFGGRVLFGSPDESSPAGRYGHEDDPHRQEHQKHDRGQGYLCRRGAEHLPGSGEDHEGRGRCSELHAVRFPADRRPVRRAHLPVHRGEEQEREDGTRGLDVEDRRGPDVLLSAAWDRDGGRDFAHRGRLL